LEKKKKNNLKLNMKIKICLDARRVKNLTKNIEVYSLIYDKIIVSMENNNLKI